MSGHLAPFVLLGKTPEGTCTECAVKHDPEQPHNAQSLAFQYKFYNQHGRWPDWRDAMAHCTDEVKEHWRRELSALGVDVDAGQVSPRKPNPEAAQG